MSYTIAFAFDQVSCTASCQTKAHARKEGNASTLHRLSALDLELLAHLLQPAALGHGSVARCIRLVRVRKGETAATYRTEGVASQFLNVELRQSASLFETEKCNLPVPTADFFFPDVRKEVKEVARSYAQQVADDALPGRVQSPGEDDEGVRQVGRSNR